MKSAYVIWFTGLSGSGKTTLARLLATVLEKDKLSVEIVDGDQFREKVHPNLKFSPQEIELNNKKIIDHCLAKLEKNDYIIVPVIAPFKKTRALARKKLGNSYIEIYCQASIDTCIKRDAKGLYKKALKGEIQNFIGIDKNVPYEVPVDPNLVVDTEKLDEHESIRKIIKYLKSRKIYESN